MTSKFTELAIDCADPARLAQFWCSVLGYREQDEEVHRLLDLRARRVDVGQGDESCAGEAVDSIIRAAKQRRSAFAQKRT